MLPATFGLGFAVALGDALGDELAVADDELADGVDDEDAEALEVGVMAVAPEGAADDNGPAADDVADVAGAVVSLDPVHPTRAPAATPETASTSARREVVIL